MEQVTIKVQRTIKGGWILDNTTDPEENFCFRPGGILVDLFIVEQTCKAFCMEPSPETTTIIRKKIKEAGLFEPREDDFSVRHITILKSAFERSDHQEGY